MATADFISVLPHHPLFKQDLEMESFFDFNLSTPQTQPRNTVPSSTQQDIKLDDIETQVFAGPSHQYEQFRQQTGIPTGDLYGLDLPLQSEYFGSSWQTRNLGLLDDNVPMSAVMSAHSGSRALSHISEGVEEEQPSHVGRLWPGMHQQQAYEAAQAKAQAQALRLARSQADTQHLGLLPQQRSRQASIAASVNEDEHVSNGFMPNVGRISKKDEEEMDEDERLLASEEGKKLSSKERRQLRNKVSARAFRSRRKEYITQLEGELNVKAQECSNLQKHNTRVTEENARYRNLIQFLIGQPAFAPVLAELNNDPAMSGVKGLLLLPPSSDAQLQSSLQSRQAQMYAESAYNPMNVSAESPTGPDMLGASNGAGNGMPYTFR